MEDPNPLLITAIHEAGHVVAAVRTNTLFGYVSIVPDETTAGRAFCEGEHLDPIAAQDDVIVTLAGYAAVLAAGYSEQVAKDGADRDFEQAQAELDFYSLSGTLADWQQKTLKLMRSPENAKAVAVLAEILMIETRLDWEDCMCIVDACDEGLNAADELARHRTWLASMAEPA